MLAQSMADGCISNRVVRILADKNVRCYLTLGVYLMSQTPPSVFVCCVVLVIDTKPT